MSNDNTPQVNLVPAVLSWKVGDKESAEIRTQVPEGTEIAYWTAGFAGWAQGFADASDFLVGLIPDDAPLNMIIQKAAHDAAKKVQGR